MRQFSSACPLQPISARASTKPVRLPLQRKLTIGAVHDPLEREADRVAEQVVRSRDPAESRLPGHLTTRRKCSECVHDEAPGSRPIQRKPPGENGLTGEVEPTPIVQKVLNSPAMPLKAESRAFFEPRFGHDFSRVRVHTGSEAATSARALSAAAYTVGPHVVFGAGRYAPDSADGRKLLAHELAHVVQQDAAGPGSQVRRQPTLPGASPITGQFALSIDNAGRVSVTASGPESAPVVSKPTIGFRRDPNGNWHLLVGGKDKVVAVDDIPKMLREAVGGKDGTAAGKPKFRVPTCGQLRRWSGAEQGLRFITFDQYQIQQRLWHSGADPLSGETWLPLTQTLFDALIERCIDQLSPLPRPTPVEKSPLQDAPERSLPEGQAYA